MARQELIKFAYVFFFLVHEITIVEGSAGTATFLPLYSAESALQVVSSGLAGDRLRCATMGIQIRGGRAAFR